MKCGPNTHRQLIVVVLLSSVLWAQTGGRQADDSRGDVKRELPIPSGEYSVGRQAVDLTDNTHPDSPSSISGGHRELMVYIWYPAWQSSSKSDSEYFPFAADIDKDPKYKEAAHGIFGASWPMIVDGSVHTHAVTDARPVVGTQFPVVLFFPGYSSTTFSYTAQIEHLVSYGYVVVAVEDTNGSGMVRFSDGRIGLLQSPPPSPDGPVLSARDNEQAAIALENLRQTEELEKAFLDKYLKDVSTSIFDQTDTTAQGITIEPIDK